MKTQKENTWLPLFPGFYDTFDTEWKEESEIENYNTENNTDLKYDDFEWDYKEFYKTIQENSIYFVEGRLKELNLVTSIKFEELISPKEYNFATDSINVEIELSKDSIKNILSYLKENAESFISHIKGKYTSGSGFISSHSAIADLWIEDNMFLSDAHKLGAILEFILLNEDSDIMNDYYADVEYEALVYCDPIKSD